MRFGREHQLLRATFLCRSFKSVNLPILQRYTNLDVKR